MNKLNFFRDVIFFVGLLLLTNNISGQGSGSFMDKLGYDGKKEEITGIQNALFHYRNAELLRIEDKDEMADTLLLARLKELKKVKGIVVMCQTTDFFWTVLGSMPHVKFINATNRPIFLPEAFIRKTKVKRIVTNCKNTADFDSLLTIKSLEYIDIYITNAVIVKNENLNSSNVHHLAILWGQVYFPEDMRPCTKIRFFEVVSHDRAELPLYFPINVVQIRLSNQAFVYELTNLPPYNYYKKLKRVSLSGCGIGVDFRIK